MKNWSTVWADDRDDYRWRSNWIQAVGFPTAEPAEEEKELDVIVPDRETLLRRAQKVLKAARK